MMMKWVVMATLLALASASDDEHPGEDAATCEREAFRSTTVNQNIGDDVTSVNDVAIVHKFEEAKGNCAEGNYGYNFDSDKTETAQVWTNGCSGLFNFDFLVAHCAEVVLDSTSTANGDYVIHELERPCFNAAVYKMTLEKEESDGKCTLGDSFGFKNPEATKRGQIKAMVWADKGCRATFHVCEISHEQEEDHQEHLEKDDH